MVVDDLLVGLDGVGEVLLLVGAHVAAVVAALRLVVAVHVQLGAATRALETGPGKELENEAMSKSHCNIHMVRLFYGFIQEAVIYHLTNIDYKVNHPVGNWVWLTELTFILAIPAAVCQIRPWLLRA